MNSHSKSNIWMTEHVSTTEMYLSEVEEVVFQGKSNYQEITIVKLVNGFKALYLDDQLQSTTYDEQIYHELLVHLPFTIHGNPKNVLIIGAGEGASARESLKWKTLNSLTLIELDPEVVNCCNKFLPEMNAGAYYNEKVKLIFTDAVEYLKNCKEKFDVIICDLCDQDLDRNEIINEKFLMLCKKILNKKGNILIQSGELPYKKDDTFIKYISMLKDNFKHLKLFTTWIPSYCRNWAFIVLQNEPINCLSLEKVDKIINRNILKELVFFNAQTYLGIFNPPKYVQEFEK